MNGMKGEGKSAMEGKLTREQAAAMGFDTGESESAAPAEVTARVANKLRTIQMLVRMGRVSMVEWSVLDHAIEELDGLAEGDE